MVQNWADVAADRIVGMSPLGKGKVLLLGATDTGKTTLMGALVNRLTRTCPVAFVDADIGQSHIGPPTTVGWTVLDRRGGADASGGEKIAVEEGAGLPTRTDRVWGPGATGGGIAFVGDVTPVGHLLQLAAALASCVEQARQAAGFVLIDTPGFVTGGAACSFWWTVQRWLRPERIIAVQRENELAELFRGLQADLSTVELIETPAPLRRKSPEARQEHRRRLFEQYFHEAAAYVLSLQDLAVRFTRRLIPENLLGRIVGLTDAAGRDLAIGVVERWQPQKTRLTIRAPQLDIRRVRCLTVGDARIDIPLGWSG